MEVINVAPVPALKGPFAEGQAAIGDHAPSINELPNPEAIAAWAGAGGVVEGEQAWLELAQAIAALVTSEMG